MNTLTISSARYLWRRPWQMMLAVTGVALGVAVVVAVDLANDSALRAFRLSMDQVAGEATHQIIGGPTGLDEQVYTRLRLHGMRDSAPVIEAYGTADSETVRILGVDPLAEAGFRNHLAREGDDAVADLIAMPDSAMLATSTARRLGVNAGEPFDLQVAGQSHRIRLVGLIDANGRSDSAIDGLMITDVATAQEITGMTGRLSWVDLALPAGPAGDRTKENIRNLLPAAAALVPAESRTHAMGQMTRAFRTNLAAMSLLALIVGMFLIYNTMTFTVVQRRALLGGLRLLGVTRGEILAMVLAEALVIGGAATVIGLGAGAVLGRGLLGLVTRTINDHYFVLTVTDLQLTVGPLIAASLLGVGATLLAALGPALEASTTSPQAALQRSSLESKSHTLMPRLARGGVAAALAACLLLLLPDRSIGGGFTALFLVVLGLTFTAPWLTVRLSRVAAWLLGGLGVYVRLAVRGIGDALSRTGVAVAALMLAVATTVGVGVMIESFRATVSEWLQATLRADIYVSTPGLGSRRASGGLDPALVEELLAVPGVAAYSAGRQVTLESDKGLTNLFVLDPAAGLTPRYPLKAGEPERVWSAFLDGRAVLVSEPLAYHRRLSIGDRIELRTARGPRTFAIAGVYYDYGSEHGEVLMPRSLYRRYFDDDAITGLGLYLAPDGRPEDIMRAVRKTAAATHAGSVVIRSNRELREISMRIFDRTFAITDVLRLLAVVVAVVGILGALMALQLERGKEIAILRAIGFTPGQVQGLVTLQTGLMGLSAGLLALPTGAALAWLLIHVINRRSFGWTMHTVIPPEVLANGVVLAVAAATAAGIYPAWRMGRMLPAAAVREE